MNFAEISGLWTCPLRYSERVALAWQLTWPAVVTDVIWSFTVYVLLEIQSQGAELLYIFPYLLLVAPWLVRRMIRKPYPAFRLKVLRDGFAAEMNYTESFKVMWLLIWRTSILTLGAIFVFSFFLRYLNVQLSSLVPRSQEAPFLNAAGLSILENTLALFLMPFVVPGMFAKRYQGFRVALDRITLSSSAPPTASRKQTRKL
ncbi:MAG: hypothetical protein JNK48_24965 [Bryobacterales bacterium]|nr:hypothetical protein [Bryobacterales bacterium]